MRRKPLVATALVSVVVGTALAVLAPSAAADSTAGSDSSPGNRGWVADPGSNRDFDDSERSGGN